MKSKLDKSVLLTKYPKNSDEIKMIFGISKNAVLIVSKLLLLFYLLWVLGSQKELENLKAKELA